MKLIHGDCLKEMFDIPDRSVDMVCCDMPYGTTACKWDTVLPLDMLWHHYKRICKDNAAIVLFASQPFTSTLVMSNRKFFKYQWVFEKSLPVGHGYAKFRPMGNHEDICVFGKGKTKYYPRMTPRDKPRIYTRKKASLSGSSSMTSHDGKTRKLEGKYPTTIQRFNTSVQKGKLHPTQKPVALIEYLIKTYTNKGDTVLDNCMGSGTTGVACKNLNRDFIGIELDEKYFEIAKQRIEGAQYNQPINRTQKAAPVI